MTPPTAPHHFANPFSSRHVRPGRLQPLTAETKIRDLPALMATIRAAGGSAAIEGSHGTGKSTLMVALAGELASAGRLAGNLQLRSTRDCLTALGLVWRAEPGSTVCLDGWERLGWPGSLAVRCLARMRGCDLLVTSHRPTGLPLSIVLAGSLRLLRAIVAELPDHGGLIQDQDLVTAFARHEGNLREALCDLYDRFEERARQPFQS